jgi:hypothetical protein
MASFSRVQVTQHRLPVRACTALSAMRHCFACGLCVHMRCRLPVCTQQGAWDGCKHCLPVLPCHAASCLCVHTCCRLPVCTQQGAWDSCKHYLPVLPCCVASCLCVHMRRHMPVHVMEGLGRGLMGEGNAASSCSCAGHLLCVRKQRRLPMLACLCVHAASSAWCVHVVVSLCVCACNRGSCAHGAFCIWGGDGS